jgi:hypothetical protein
MNPKEKKKASSAKKQKTSNATSSSPILVDEAEGMGSPQTPDSSQLSQGQRPMGRKRAKEQLKNKGGDDSSYKNVVQELLVEKKEEKKMKDSLFPIVVIILYLSMFELCRILYPIYYV